MQFSEHFKQDEFEKDGPIPSDCVPVFQGLCQKVLEPVRAHVGRQIDILSGYRPTEANKAAHGAPHSEHMATSQYCAADFTFATTFGLLISVRSIFDWIRTNSAIPWHQCILEHGANGQSIIHVSYTITPGAVRSALEGATHNASAYTPWDCVAYDPRTEQEIA